MKKSTTAAAARAAAEPRAGVVSRIEQPEPSAQHGAGEAALVPTAEVVLTSTLLVTGAAERVAPNILSIAHCDRLLGGELYAPLSRVDWATLLRRTFDIDLLRCHGCAGCMTVRTLTPDYDLFTIKSVDSKKIVTHAKGIVGTDVTDNYAMLVGSPEKEFKANEQSGATWKRARRFRVEG